MNNNYLLNELIYYANNLRAETVYFKCLRAGKLKWAENIKRKYDIKSRQYDSTIALGYAMMYLKNKMDYERK